MFRECYGRRREDVYGFMFEFLDGEEIKGQLLSDKPFVPGVVFCNNPLQQKKVDDEYLEEHETVRGKTQTILFSYEDLLENRLSLFGSNFEGLAVYRGWMLRPEQYEFLFDELKKQGIILINSPEEYERYHLLPNWYDDFKADTAKSVWVDGEDVEGLMLKVQDWKGPAIIKDYVKSRKHEWFSACFINQIRDRDNAMKVINTFIERQAEDLVGGLVLRSFLPLKNTGFHEISGMPTSEEYRIFIYGGRIISSKDYWAEGNGEGLNEDDINWINSRISRIKSSFVTIDVARKTDGSLCIVELGDGQVSGLQQMIPDEFYKEIIT